MSDPGTGDLPVISEPDLKTLFEEALKSIYNELVDVKTEIEPNLFNATFDALNHAVDTGFGSISYDDPDFGFLNELKYSNGVFAAFKTHRQQNDLAAQLLDENGNLKTFEQFRKDTEAILSDYNRNWLKTEYDTAVIRARMAARFKEFQRDADLYPNLKWLKSTSVVKRELHVNLYGLILPIDDPFWTQQYPGSLWNCKCGITNTDEPVNGDAYDIEHYDMPTPPAGLEGNPAFTSQIFSDNNTYQANAYPGAKKAVNFELEPLLKEYSIQFVRDLFKKLIPEGGLKIAVNNGPIEDLTLSLSDIKRLTGKPHADNFLKNLVLPDIADILKNAEYLGTGPDRTIMVGGKSIQEHPGVIQWQYYSFELGGETSYIGIKEYKGNKFKIHMIQDSDHFDPAQVISPTKH